MNYADTEKCSVSQKSAKWTLLGLSVRWRKKEHSWEQNAAVFPDYVPAPYNAMMWSQAVNL